MRRLAALVGFALAVALALPAAPAQARIDCHPNCDFVHDYGPHDLSWVRPGLFCYPRCDARGNCAPSPVCVVAPDVAGRSAFTTGYLDGRRPAGTVTVRPRVAPRR